MSDKTAAPEGDFTIEDEDDEPSIREIVEEAKDDEAKYQEAMDFFLSDERPDTEKGLVVRRWSSKAGEKVVVTKIRIRSIDEDEHRECMLRASKAVRKGKKNETANMLDSQALASLFICEKAIIEPNLRDERILEKYKTPTRALQDKLSSGERGEIAYQVLDISGFNDSIENDDDEIDEEFEAAKNF